MYHNAIRLPPSFWKQNTETWKQLKNTKINDQQFFTSLLFINSGQGSLFIYEKDYVVKLVIINGKQIKQTQTQNKHRPPPVNMRVAEAEEQRDKQINTCVQKKELLRCQIRSIDNNSI